MKVKSLRDRKGKVDREFVIAEDGSYIRNKKTGKKINIYTLKKGYRACSLRLNGHYYKRIGIHILQWLAWKGKIPKGFLIHHNGKDKNGKYDRLNNHIDCLRCITMSEHMKIHNSGENHPLYGTHRTEETKKKIGKSRIGKYAGENNSMWGKHHTEEACRKISISKIGKRDSEEVRRKKSESQIGLQAGEKNPMAKLTNNEAEEIIRLFYIEHLTYQDIVNKYDVSVTCIKRVTNGHSYNPDHLSKSELIRQTQENFSIKKSYFLE